MGFPATASIRSWAEIPATAMAPLQALDERLARLQACLERAEQNAQAADAVLEAEAQAMQRWLEAMRQAGSRLAEWTRQAA
jgi:predicted lysophospholipase L1 biosynthesis ABC-type transport system permease subunit